MRKIFLAVLLFLLCTSAYAFEGKNSGVSLGLFNKINCSTGMTCAKASNGVMTVTSSPSAVGSSLSVTASEATSATLGLLADQADDNGDTWTIVSEHSPNQLTINNDATGSAVAAITVGTGGGVSLASTLAVTGASTLSGDVIGDGGDQLYGFKKNQYNPNSPDTLTISQCGSTVIALTDALINLPEASTALGCRYTFVNYAGILDVNPDDADQIVSETNAVGDSIRSTTSYDTMTIEATSSSTWTPISTIGTWADND